MQFPAPEQHALRPSRRAALHALLMGTAGPLLAAATRMAAAASPRSGVAVPASVTLEYRVRARLHGFPLETSAQLVWQHGNGSYHAEWDVQVPLLGERRQRSDGRVTETGLLPERYSEQTRRTSTAQFDWSGGQVQFGSGGHAAALQPGAQDRLSISLQLGLLAAAARPAWAAGHQISIQTVGVRSAEAWRWQVTGSESLAVGTQTLECLLLARQPRKENDKQIDLWLAPALQHLPARLRVAEAGGDVVDQQLRALPGQS